MPREKPPIHGRDHRPGGADPIVLTGFLHWGTNNDDGSLGLVLDTTQTDIIIETLGSDVGQQIRLVSGGQINSIASSQNLMQGESVVINGSSTVLIEGGSIQTLSANIEEKLVSGTDRWRVSDAAGSSLLVITEAGSISANSHQIHDVTNPSSGQDAATKNYVDTAVAGSAVSSVFGRSGAVVAVSGDYAGVVASFLTGATSASRYVGATASGAPVSGTFATGDFVIARDGHLFVCTAGGSPGTWADVGAGATFVTPSIALGSAAAAGSASTFIRSDATIAAFDTTAPTTQTFGDSAAVGTSAFAARRDHKHAWPANVTEANISLAAANTTNDVTITKHGFVPIAPNDTAKFLRGDGTWNTANLPSGSAAVATDAIWDTKGDVVAATGADAAVKVPAGANGTVLMAASGSTPGVKWAPPITEYDYVERTTTLTVTATSDATATSFIDGNAVTYDGSTRVKIEFWAWVGIIDNNQSVICNLYDGSTDLGRITALQCPSGIVNSVAAVMYGVRYLTPSNASHTYHIKAWKSGGTATVNAGAGGTGTTLPAFLRITIA